MNLFLYFFQADVSVKYNKKTALRLAEPFVLTLLHPDCYPARVLILPCGAMKLSAAMQMQMETTSSTSTIMLQIMIIRPEIMPIRAQKMDTARMAVSMFKIIAEAAWQADGAAAQAEASVEAQVFI